MSWECADCGRRHDEPPETCACGSADISPIDTAGAGEGGRAERFSLLGVKRRLFAPQDADRSLVSDDERLTLVFRVLLVASLVLAIFALIALLV